SVGEAQVALNTGGLRLSHALDFDLSPGTDVGGSPALVYNSETVDVHPIIELHADGLFPWAVQSVTVRLTFDGKEQVPVTFTATACCGSPARATTGCSPKARKQAPSSRRRTSAPWWASPAATGTPPRTRPSGGSTPPANCCRSKTPVGWPAPTTTTARGTSTT